MSNHRLDPRLIKIAAFDNLRKLRFPNSAAAVRVARIKRLKVDKSVKKQRETMNTSVKQLNQSQLTPEPCQHPFCHQCGFQSDLQGHLNYATPHSQAHSFLGQSSKWKLQAARTEAREAKATAMII